MSMEANAFDSLGSPVEIADAAASQFRQRKGRLARSRLAAFSTFVLLPLPLLVVAWFVSMLVLALSLEGLAVGLEWSGFVAPVAADPGAQPDPYEPLEGLLQTMPQAYVLLAHLATILVLVIPAAGTAVLFGRLARHTPRRWLWGLTACGLVGLGFGASHYELKFSDQPGKNQNMFMFGIGRQPLRQCGIATLPLAVGILVLRRTVPSAGGLREVS